MIAAAPSSQEAAEGFLHSPVRHACAVRRLGPRQRNGPTSSMSGSTRCC